MWTLIYKRLWWGPVWKLVQLLKRIGFFLSLFFLYFFSVLGVEGLTHSTSYFLLMSGPLVLGTDLHAVIQGSRLVHLDSALLNPWLLKPFWVSGSRKQAEKRHSRGLERSFYGSVLELVDSLPPTSLNHKMSHNPT